MDILAILTSKVIRKPLIIAWCSALVISASVPLITGQIYGNNEALSLLTSLQKSSLYYASAIATASATILALMLTILSLTQVYKGDPRKETFTRLHAIAAFCVFGFIGAVILLFIISLPVEQFDGIPNAWFSSIYYTICIWNGMLAGHMISTILILRDTATQLIGDLSPDYDEDGNDENDK